ncbi:hypothetical protein RAM_35825 [Amycolatopsis mediterranei S699]|uniref:Uncharacterized protein n=1 Tax=Amycolatopsis mediterranei (strain S699) TaxID=713604 RepID=A0A9R0P3G3_AMYMS|nr:hypothetical protein RAM_35825 [Amycolatopsis mediterranei S699]
MTTGFEPLPNGVIPPGNPVSDGEIRRIGDHVRPKSRDFDSTIGDSVNAPVAS